MGASTSKVLGDIGSVVGNAIIAPLKSVFGRSCENICGGIFDVVCFIEHICILDMVKFLLACCLCYACLVFLYLFYKLGICQCITRSLCKMCWAACETYWFILEYVCCYCWHKIRYTKRVYRGRQRLRRQLSRDIEVGYISPSPSLEDLYDEYGSSLTRKRKSRRETTWRRRRRRRNQGSSTRLKKRQLSIGFNSKSRRGRRRDPSTRYRTSTLGRSRRYSTTKFKKPRLSISNDY